MGSVLMVKSYNMIWCYALIALFGGYVFTPNSVFGRKIDLGNKKQANLAKLGSYAWAIVREAEKLWNRLQDSTGDEAEELGTSLADFIEHNKAVLLEEEKDKFPSTVEAPEADLTPCQIITRHGYACQSHHVATEDGYMLEIHRIPGNKKPTVYLQHGLLASSADYILNKKHECLPFILADAGYDVWIGNARGNKYSRGHKTMSPKKREFWDFSLDELGKYDLPAVINHALKISGNKQLYYVGFSQGSFMGFTQFGQHPQLKGKIKKFFAMAPVYTIGHLSSALKYLVPFSNTIHAGLRLFGQHEFLPNSFLMRLIAKGCGLISLGRALCNNIVFLIAGASSANKDVTRIPTYLAHIPSGTSTKNVMHFAQLVKSKKALHFNYGSTSENKKKYGNDYESPPEYDITKMTVPTVIFWAGKDKLAPPEDVRAWKGKVPTLVADHYYENYDHLDFMWATDAYEQVYSKILDYIKKDATA